jgi:phosphoglycolate phosphatase-like HAD superfamily hydrolase
MPYKAVLFDLDGTIANTLPLCILAFRRSIEPLAGRSVTDQEIIDTFGPSEEGTISAMVPAEFYEKGVSDYLSHYEENHAICEQPFEGIIEVLEELKARDIRIGMVTGKGRKSAEISLSLFGLTQYFEKLETGSPEGSRKAACIKKILGEWPHISKDEVLYVGDVPSDIIASREAGVTIVSAAWAETTTEPEELVKLNPDKIFYSVGEFREWLLSAI